MERYDKKERHSNSDKELEQPAAPDAAQIPSALRAWGWTEEWEQKAHDALEARVAGAGGLTDSLVPARVIQHVHHTYELVVAPTAECVTAEVTGAFAYRVATPAEYPTVGDWVLMDPEGRRIHTVLPRRTAIRRSAAGNETLEQVITANTDILFLVFGLDGGRNFTVGLLERSLVTAWNSGSRPLVVLNKADCAAPEAIESARLEAESHAPGVSVHVVSAERGDGLEDLVGEAHPGTTIGMIGKSGVGKSALLNAFMGGGETPARVGNQRNHDLQGRHTTSDKQLYRLPSGALIADVPGLRELQLWGDVDILEDAFPDIERLARECRFSDCAHAEEPDCRVQQALATGELPHERFERYLDYRRELAYLERRRDERAVAEERKKWKDIAKERRRMKKMR